MPTTDTQLGQVLLAQARKAIADALGLPAPAAPDHPSSPSAAPPSSP
jgi:hypothetical protein